MKTISTYKEDIKNLMKKSGDIDAQAIAENRELTEAELALKNEILDTVEETQKIVVTLERQERMTALFEKPEAPQTTPKGKVKIEVGDDRATKDKFSSFGQQLFAVINAGCAGGHVDPRLYNATGLNENKPSDGGFLVQTDFSNQLLQDLVATEDLANRCRKIQISGAANSMKMNGVDETSRASPRPLS